jgi:MFS family permease
VTTATLVRAPGVLRTLALALLARIPLGAVGLLLVLQVRHLGHSYALAGACSGACALGMAFGAPMLGRTVDRIG